MTAVPYGSDPPNRLERRKQRTRSALVKAAQQLIAEGKVNVPVLEKLLTTGKGPSTDYECGTASNQPN